MGWREWLTLPDLGVNHIKAKIDTGAKTSALHASSINIIKEGKNNYLHFQLFPVEKNNQVVISCKTDDILGQKLITNSSGHKELRYTIKTNIILGNRCWPIEITLTNRDKMGFRMLLGRSALQNTIINPNQSFLASQKGEVQ
ncbi:ATP-dependent zinc protease [Coxiella-like endosymbiont of Amblyomma americanum]|nr:ATP-dependent zinc protease [Coxiella-like endosymbiont of Amblyomma americanum]